MNAYVSFLKKVVVYFSEPLIRTRQCLQGVKPQMNNVVTAMCDYSQ
jgi:hypothetical protein